MVNNRRGGKKCVVSGEVNYAKLNGRGGANGHLESSSLSVDAINRCILFRVIKTDRVFVHSFAKLVQRWKLICESRRGTRFFIDRVLIDDFSAKLMRPSGGKEGGRAFFFFFFSNVDRTYRGWGGGIDWFFGSVVGIYSGIFRIKLADQTRKTASKGNSKRVLSRFLNIYS